MNRFEAVVRTVRGSLGLTSRSPLSRALAPAYERLLDAVYPRGLTRVLHRSEPIRVRPQYRALDEDREPAMFRALQRLVSPGMSVLDVGASFGEFAIVLARWCGPGGRVVAFEPAAAARLALLDHLRLNALVDRVDVVDAAVSDFVGEGTLYVIGRSGENTLNPDGFGGRAVPVPVAVTTVDAYCERRALSPAVIKIDVEGLEFHALRGAAQVIARCRPAIVIELHPAAWRAVGESADTGAAAIASLPYALTFLDGQRSVADGGHILLEPLH
jgi:FkbM family methyltransferase